MPTHTRYYRNADITLQVNSDLPFKSDTFDPKFELFRVDYPGDDLACIHHHFDLPALDIDCLGQPVYQRAPWAIYHTQEGWTYVGILPERAEAELWKVATFDHDHTSGQIYHPGPEIWSKGGLDALTSFPTDQIWIARLLADRAGCYLHSAGAIINGKGVLFVGHSEAGKTTTTQMLIDASQKSTTELEVEILCDDRNIVRRMPDGWRLFGSWSHGDIPLVSAASAPLVAICFLEQSAENSLIRIIDKQENLKKLLACLIKPIETKEWWQKSLILIEDLSENTPCYRMRFDKSGLITNHLFDLIGI